MKEQGEKIVMLTAYDYVTAQLIDQAGVPLILVGDSLGIVVLGYETTLPVTLEEMLHHVKAVGRGAQRAFVVADMPFMTYQVSAEQALLNAGRFLQEGTAQGVKLEGGEPMAPTVARLVEVGIPVMGHIGLTPQSVHQLGGYRVQGRTVEVARRLLNDARCLEQAGAFAIVLECVPAPLAAAITERVNVPTIGIGAGAGCDGQVQVLHDLLGLFTGFVPRHAKQYAQLAQIIRQAVETYRDEVQAGTFPTAEHAFGMEEAILREALAEE